MCPVTLNNSSLPLVSQTRQADTSKRAGSSELSKAESSSGTEQSSVLGKFADYSSNCRPAQSAKHFKSSFGNNQAEAKGLLGEFAGKVGELLTAGSQMQAVPYIPTGHPLYAKLLPQARLDMQEKLGELQTASQRRTEPEEDVWFDTNEEFESDAKPETEVKLASHGEPETEVKLESHAEPEAEVKLESHAESEAEVESESDAEPEAEEAFKKLQNAFYGMQEFDELGEEHDGLEMNSDGSGKKRKKPEGTEGNADSLKNTFEEAEHLNQEMHRPAKRSKLQESHNKEDVKLESDAKPKEDVKLESNAGSGAKAEIEKLEKQLKLLQDQIAALQDNIAKLPKKKDGTDDLEEAEKYNAKMFERKKQFERIDLERKFVLKMYEKAASYVQ